MNENKMPNLNSMPSPAGIPSAKPAGEVVEQPSESVPAQTLNVPSYETEKPTVVTDSNEQKSSTVVKPMIVKSGIEVVATAPGFYKQNRIKVGERFTVANFEDLGMWMKCEDREIEKKRVEFLESKKQKAKNK